jgi:chitin disaccharide deacetylase
VLCGFSLRHLRLRAFDRKTFNREVREGIAKIAKKTNAGFLALLRLSGGSEFLPSIHLGALGQSFSISQENTVMPSLRYIRLIYVRVSLIALVIFIGSLPVVSQAAPKSVQERLGYPASARLLILHADDFGMNHSVNRATSEALEHHWITSASILVPCPWFLEAANFAKAHPDADLGIHQALTSEWTTFRWGPVTSKDQVPSLLDAQGYLPSDTPEVASKAKSDEVERELRAQIERARNVGVNVSHLDSHMVALFQTPELFSTYQKLGASFRVPILAARAGSDHAVPASVKMASDEVLIDRVIEMSPGVDAKDWLAWYEKQLSPLGPGVYEVILHLAYDDDEMRGATFDHPDWGSAWRQHDLDMVKSPEFQKFLKDQGFILVGWKDVAKALPKNYGSTR